MRRIFWGFLLSMAPAVTASDSLKVETLLESTIEAISSHTVLMNRVTMEAHTSMPRHYHPSEEFLYVASGSVLLQVDGEIDQLLRAGAVYKIPAKVIHNAMTQDEKSEIIVFRVHPTGLPVAMPPKDK